MFATMIVAVVAAFAGYTIYQSQNTNTLSDLALANVEALAQMKGGDSDESSVCRWDEWLGRCTKIDHGSQCGLVDGKCDWL